MYPPSRCRHFIQPLVENAIRHGIERLPAGGQLDVLVRHSANTVEVIVANDLPTTGVRSDGYAVGLSLTRERVHAMTDGRGRAESRIENGRYIATLHLPVATTD